jgi:hypothetical protein
MVQMRRGAVVSAIALLSAPVRAASTTTSSATAPTPLTVFGGFP